MTKVTVKSGRPTKANDRILGHVLMGNHWHFVVWPNRGKDHQVSAFFRWLTVTHSQRWHAYHGTAGMGHVYQGGFKSFPVATDEHLLTLLRYVEHNPLRAGLVKRAEDWRWGSLHRRTRRAAPSSNRSWRNRRRHWVETASSRSTGRTAKRS